MRQVVTKAQLAGSDVSIVYVSDSVSAPNLKLIEIATERNVVAKNPVAALMKSSNPGFAQQFISCQLSPDAQAIFRNWRLGPLG